MKNSLPLPSILLAIPTWKVEARSQPSGRGEMCHGRQGLEETLGHRVKPFTKQEKRGLETLLYNPVRIARNSGPGPGTNNCFSFLSPVDSFSAQWFVVAFAACEFCDGGFYVIIYLDYF